MNNHFATLEDLCEIRTGMPTGRAKKAISEAERQDVLILLPKAVTKGRIAREKLEAESLSKLNPDLLTRPNDVVVKLSPPYESAVIGEGDAGALVSSSLMILRKRCDADVDMVFLTMFLNSEFARSQLQHNALGETTLQQLQRRRLAELEIPLPPMEEQERLAALFQNVQDRNAKCREMISLGETLLAKQIEEAIWKTGKPKARAGH